MKLEQIYKTLKDFVEKEEALQCKWPCDSDYNVPTWDKIYDALEILDSIINYEPSDAELEAYNDYQDPPHVVNQRMLEMKSESHGRRFI
tara:strand:- start:321 stop:587 length:267 start_codon:yes stop_codon:yes gene_type:complete